MTQATDAISEGASWEESAISEHPSVDNQDVEGEESLLGEGDEAMAFVDDILEEHGLSQDTAHKPSIAFKNGAVSNGLSSTSHKDYSHEWVETIPHHRIEVRMPTIEKRWEYKTYDLDVQVEEVLGELALADGVGYRILRKDGRKDKVTLNDLMNLPAGRLALDHFLNSSKSSQISRSDSDITMVSERAQRAKRPRSEGFLDSSAIKMSEDGRGTIVLDSDSIQRGRGRPRLDGSRPTKRTKYVTLDSDSRSSSASSSTGSGHRKNFTNGQRRRTARLNGRNSVNYQEQRIISSSESESNNSEDEHPRRRKRKHTVADEGPIRRSERSGRHVRSMRERGENDIPDVVIRNSSKANKPISAKEVFQTFPDDDPFRLRHCYTCDSCGDQECDEKGQLIYCQGCTLSYHQSCLRSQNSREHLTTKISDKEYVLQCRRCIEFTRKKDDTAPHHGRCSECAVPGASCAAFRERKASKEEQSEREKLGGIDPVTLVDSDLINSTANLLFRCVRCYQGFHFHHLPPKQVHPLQSSIQDRVAEDRFAEYSYDWWCHDCLRASKVGDVGGLVAWRPLDPNKFPKTTTVERVPEDEKEYLVKWKARSYYKCLWMRGQWVWGITSAAMRIAFARRDNGINLPKFRTEDAIPEDYLRVDIIFEIKYNNIVTAKIEDVDLARVKEVEKARVKYKGLGYEDVVWEEPPDSTDIERWNDFKAAYDDWVRGRYIHLPQPGRLEEKINSFRKQDFKAKIALEEQPKALTGGKLMEYQLEGVNWLLYQYHQKRNAVLADEMGLGKTIQVVGFLSALQGLHNCFPFLIVVPNATCANWRREIKLWAPSLRVVTYFGSAQARELARKFQMFPHAKPTDLACHVVVTSYDTAQDEECQRILRKIHWAAMIVDEGQRLKNDENLLYAALSSMKTPFKLLLTGTPLQNHVRELLNLLQFLDPAIVAAELEEEYAVLTKENVPKLHDMIRPYILRRTKAGVLTFLPPMAQIIVPVTMTSLQKQLYKTILAKNFEDLKSIFVPGANPRQGATKNLRNTLMQLRKCLCHPFIYDQAIEERSKDKIVLHHRLVAAASKLQLLELMLPKLQERGHRVLIFSQFLDMLTIMEDFLDGLGLQHKRLDGSMGSMEKQKVIDHYNAPDSSLFALLLSTRAGGVGINLATADTVIILDPDFNPHQDIQAISRAHRIGQKNKVLVFQLMTRTSAEEKIMQLGKKKMAMDHVLIEQLDAQEVEGADLESVLRFGAEALFKDDDTNDIRYDSTSVEKLLDRTQIEDTKTDSNASAQSQFGFARTWINDASALQEQGVSLEVDGGEPQNSEVWDKILELRKQEYERERSRIEQTLGRGKRSRQNVDYSAEKDAHGADDADGDSAFEDREALSQSSEESGVGEKESQMVDANELKSPTAAKSRSTIVPEGSVVPTVRKFQRAHVSYTPSETARSSPDLSQALPCLACNWQYGKHKTGYCPLKLAGPEYCNLCGLAHYGFSGTRNCVHLQSERQINLMLQGLKSSPEPQALVEKAHKYLTGLKANLVQIKKRRLLESAKLPGPRLPRKDQRQTHQPALPHHPHQHQLHSQNPNIVVSRGEARPSSNLSSTGGASGWPQAPQLNGSAPNGSRISSTHPTMSYNQDQRGLQQFIHRPMNGTSPYVNSQTFRPPTQQQQQQQHQPQQPQQPIISPHFGPRFPPYQPNHPQPK